MLFGRRPLPRGLRTPTQIRGPRLSRSFQFKIAASLSCAVAGTLLLFALPSFYFLHQNYEIFKTLAFDGHPGLIKHLEREIAWLEIFLVMGVSVSLTVSFFFALRLTRHLMNPLIALENHLRELQHGHWSIPELDLPPDEDYRNLTLTYDYFYRSLQANTEMEIELLKKMAVDPRNREAYAAWKSLIDQKSQRLGQTPASIDPVSGTFAGSDATSHQRRAS